VGIPLTKGFRLSRSLFHKLFFFSQQNSGYHEALFTIFFFFTMEFWLSRSLSPELFPFHDGILAIKEPFTRTFYFSRWNSGYQGAFHTNFSFFTMEFWLSRSLSHELFFFHENSGYQGAFHTNFSFFTMEFWLSRSLSHELFFFHDGIHKMHDLGEDSFHIYHKEYLHRIRLVKNLASW
jgi:hypothetical protein